MTTPNSSSRPRPRNQSVLSISHREHLKTSGLTDETMALAGFYTIADSRSLATTLGYKRWSGGKGGAIAIPVLRPGRSKPETIRCRPDSPRIVNGRAVKYDQRSTKRGGPGVVVYYPPRTLSGRLRGSALVVWTEGEKKACTLDQEGYAVVGLTGVWNAHDATARKSNQGLKLHTWLREDLLVKGRDHVICFDADAWTNDKVMSAAKRLAGLLHSVGARSVKMARIPGTKDEPKRGIDDLYLAEGAKSMHRVISSAEPIAGPPVEARPEVFITAREHEVNAAVIKALSHDSSIYQRSRQLVHILPRQAGPGGGPGISAPVIAPLPPALLRSRIAAAVRFCQSSGDGVEDAHPPRWCVEAVNADGALAGIRPLAGIVEQPTLRPDGTLLESEGYDAATGLEVIFPPGSSWPAVPKSPSNADAVAGVSVLKDLVRDFRFEQPHHESSWLALVLTLLIRHAIPGPVPIWLIDAPVAGAGKGLLAEAACCIATGRSIPLDGFPRSDEEFDKRLLAWALSGRLVVGLDNVSGTLGGDSLCRALTANTVSGRVLGSTEERSSQMRAVIVATGNNVSLGPDMHRRVAHIRLAVQEEDPSLRTGFKYPDLPAHIRAHRPELVVAALTIVRAYLCADGPKVKLPAWGSYESWSAIIRAALVWSGLADPAECRRELRENADGDLPLHRALVLGWRDLVAVEHGALTAKRAIEIVCTEEDQFPETREAIEGLSKDRRGNTCTRKLGRTLNKLRNRVFADEHGATVTMEKDGRAHGNSIAWRTVVPGGDGGSGGDVPEPRARENTATHQAAVIRKAEEAETSPPSPPSPPSGRLEPRSSTDLRNHNSGNTRPASEFADPMRPLLEDLGAPITRHATAEAETCPACSEPEGTCDCFVS